MNSLALTDGLLCAVSLYIAQNRTLPVAFRLSAGLFATAAFWGVLRFSGLYPLPSWHQFFSMLGAVSAFPLLAVAIIWPNALATRSTRFAWIFMCVAAVIGVVLVGAAQKRIYADGLALLSIIAILVTLLRARLWLGTLASSVMLLALVGFALKLSVGTLLLPGDLLHLGMACGLLLLSGLPRWPAAHVWTTIAPTAGPALSSERPPYMLPNNPLNSK
jgi:hypothetical protein